MSLPKPPVPTYDLEIPSTGKKIKFRPFLVKEEKVLLIALESKDEEQIKNAVVECMKSCVLTKGIKIEDLAMFDLEYIFLNVRAKAAGEVVEMLFTAKDDSETQLPYNLNLEEVQVIRPEGHDNKIELDQTSGMIMKYPGLNQFIDSQIIQKEQSTTEVFDVIVDCVEQIYSGDDVWDAKTTPRKEIVEYLDGLTSKQFEAVQKFFATMPKVSHTFKLMNPNTGVESEYTIEGLANFFG
jgi:hypothetical protein